MPNGSHLSPEEWQEIVSFFDGISEPLNDFANRFNLVIDKYYHNGPDWTFRFRHPLGGNGQISVLLADSEGVWMGLSWYIDDLDTFSRSLKYETWKNISVEPTHLSALLEKALRTVLGWQLGQWTQVASGYEDSWARYSKEEWERMKLVYPLPKMESDS